MKVHIQMVISHDNQQQMTYDILGLECKELSLETLGLTLTDSKMILVNVQKAMVSEQTKEFISQHKGCRYCGKSRAIKGYHTITYRTLFGRLILQSPRLLECACLSQKVTTISPLTKVLVERTSPELLYLESKWASLMSYGVTASLLEEVFPIKISASTICSTAMKVATRLEQELPEEAHMFVEGCQNMWDRLPRPDLSLTVGLDGGYVHAREGADRKAGWFEVVVGKSMQAEHPSKRFGYVSTYDTKPKRRLYEMLKEQGLQMNQAITFLTDGGDTVRELPLYLSPRSEHILDWFHIAMRITAMTQTAKGQLQEEYPVFLGKIERIKWYLWHGNVFRALDDLEALNEELYSWSEEVVSTKETKQNKLWKLVDEFETYIKNNQAFIVNYGEKYRYDETISTAFVESTVNELISRRMAKKQQMRWTKKGAHLLLQLRIKTLNGDLRALFIKWYPGMEIKNETFPRAA